jgi:MFS family permease
MTTAASDNTVASANPMKRVMALRDFRLLFAGATTSLLGDQFALIATPWLVLQLTGDPLALGIVLALEGIPRAAFMLVGGAITDRLSPRLIMLASDTLRLVLTALMAAVIFAGVVHMWMVYAFALGFGLVAGFAVPAENSIVPMIVDEGDLQAGNSLMMGVTQLAGFVGPTIAGILIGGYSSSDFGIGLAFAIDAVTFAVSAITLWLIRTGQRHDAGAPQKETVWDSILAGVRHLWNDQSLRFLFLVMTAINFLMVGPLLVGIPVLADERLPEGAVAFGLLMSAYAGGNLVGYLLAGALPAPRGIVLRIILIALLGGFGTVIGAMGFLRSTWVDFGLLLALGVGNGYIGIILFTWIQRQTPQIMLGRMMSMVMFASTGLVPVSEALSGAVSKWDLTMLFASAGVLVFLVTLWTAVHPQMKTFSQSLSAAPEA